MRLEKNMLKTVSPTGKLDDKNVAKTRSTEVEVRNLLTPSRCQSKLNFQKHFFNPVCDH